MSNKESLIDKEKRKIGIFLGAGFDKNIGMPLLDDFINKTYIPFLLKKVGKNNKKKVKIKLDLILDKQILIMRRYSMIKNIEKGMHDKENWECEEYTYNINSYLENKKELTIIKEFVETIKKYSNIRVITTNISNTLEKMGMKPVKTMNDMIDTNSFLPIHGLIHHPKEFQPILLEEHYLDNDYKELTLSLNEYQEIHIFGYSLSDLKILEILKNLKNPKIKYYYLFESQDSKKVWEEHIKNTINFQVLFFSYKDNYPEKLIYKLKEEVIKNGVLFSNFEEFENFFSNKNNNKFFQLLNYNPYDVWHITKKICSDYKGDHKNTNILIQKLLNEEGNNKSKIMAIDAILKNTAIKFISRENWEKIDPFYIKMLKMKVFNKKFYTNGIMRFSQNTDLLLEISKEFKFVPIFQFRDWEDVLNLLKKENSFAEWIIFGLFNGYVSSNIYIKNTFDDPAPLEIYQAAFKAMKNILNKNIFWNKNFPNLLEGKKIIERLIYDGYGYRINSFYYPFAIAAQIILWKKGKYNNKMREIKKNELEDNYSILNFAGILGFLFFDQRDKIILETNNGHFKISNSLRMIMGIKKEEVKNMQLYTIQNQNNNYQNKVLDLDKIKTKKDLIETINKKNDLHEIKDIIINFYKKECFLKINFNDFQKLKLNIRGMFLLYLSKTNFKKAVFFLKKDNFNSLDENSSLILKPETLDKKDIHKLAIKFNSFPDEAKGFLNLNSLIKTNKGIILKSCFFSLKWQEKDIKEFIANDSIKWWIESIKYFYKFQYELPSSPTNWNTFISAFINLFPLTKEIINDQKIWKNFLRYISNSELQTDCIKNQKIIDFFKLIEHNNHREELVQALNKNINYKWNSIINEFIFKYNKKFKEFIFLLMKFEKFNKELNNLIQQEINSKILSQKKIKIPNWIVKKNFLNQNIEYKIMPYDLHSLCAYLARNNYYKDEEIIKIISHIERPPKNEIYKNIEDNFIGIDGITQLLNKLEKKSEQKILKILKIKFPSLPYKYLNRMDSY